LRIVAKHLVGPAAREALVYERLVMRHVPVLGPPVLAIVPARNDVVVFMEAVRRRCGWPWREVSTAARVLEAVAQLHASESAVQDVPAWDYEAELELRAAETLDAVERARRSAIAPLVSGALTPLLRLIGEQREWRRTLVAGPLAPCAIHGDLHTGNVVIGGEAPGVTLLDWARARIGSPLEDVCSWLQSLAFWEPEVRRRHDTLLNAYLCARGVEGPASRAMRFSYWLAGASNALSGALAFHLNGAMSTDASARQRARSIDAARDWLRIVRRADACWSGARPGRDDDHQEQPQPVETVQSVGLGVHARCIASRPGRVTRYTPTTASPAPASSVIPNLSPRTTAPSAVAMGGDTYSHDDANTDPASRTTMRLSECPRIDPTSVR
jgi:Ser/Thr protein kinase RdoA (MazF antagonist)